MDSAARAIVHFIDLGAKYHADGAARSLPHQLLAVGAHTNQELLLRLLGARVSARAPKQAGALLIDWEQPVGSAKNILRARWPRAAA